MKAYDVIAYTYEGEAYCPDCFEEPKERDPEVSPIFASDEVGPDGLYCGSCGCEIVEPIDLKLTLRAFEVDRLVRALGNDAYMKSIVERLVALQEEAYGSR